MLVKTTTARGLVSSSISSRCVKKSFESSLYFDAYLAGELLIGLGDPHHVRIEALAELTEEPGDVPVLQSDHRNREIRHLAQILNFGARAIGIEDVHRPDILGVHHGSGALARHAAFHQALEGRSNFGHLQIDMVHAAVLLARERPLWIISSRMSRRLPGTSSLIRFGSAGISGNRRIPGIRVGRDRSATRPAGFLSAP